MTTRDKILSAIRADPRVSFTELARRLGVTKQRVSQIAIEAGVDRRKSIIEEKLSHRPEYKCWKNMIYRCTKPDCKLWIHYGGRGITVCQRWINSFDAFLSDMGQRPTENHTLERIDSDKGYSPLNCKWATWKEQNNNRRSTPKHRVEKRDSIGKPPKFNAAEAAEIKRLFDGGMSYSQLAKRFDCSPATIKNYIRGRSVPRKT